MPFKSTRLPKYRHYKPKDLAVVRIDGKDHYLGKFGSEESQQKYRRLIAEMLAAPATAQPPTPRPDGDGGPTINELLVSYWDFVQGYYTKDGRPTSEPGTIRQALRPIQELYGDTPARDFGPLSLKAARRAMIERGWCRTFINKQINRIKKLFSWAAGEEILPLSVYQALTTVEGLRKDRTDAREKPPVGPVSDEAVERTLPYLTTTVASMVRLQRLTGMRPGEVVLMRAIDIDMSDPVCWVYRPGRHKSQHHDRERLIFLGPRAQSLLRPFLTLDVTGYVFSPRRSVAQWRAEQRARRQSPPTPSQAARRPKANPRRTHGELYHHGSYRKAIRKACQRAGIPIWHPHMLRHSAAGEIRRRFGLEAAQAVLGHSELGTTQIYAAADLAMARRIMLETG
jgi:integrase